ncbi:MAG TPA: TIGR03809 family protein [Bradyrhizobium sp.]|uniref:TIGR03809 family protein n=1 Tax=Bradyrhizobium sp. TaxID=376 RepID=UPI002BE1A77A|nr:TIGR03809 family protein [Bradyrhizobium sp.]HLZ05537.1 TIGR03809 family protein [Bradyrhizobium sp.]
MTDRNNATSDVLGRWRMLAEQRLEHLTELFESGRWRRYYGEVAFLENIREAKVAVETWRGLSAPRAAAEPVIKVRRPEPARELRPPIAGPSSAVAPRPIVPPPAAVAAEEASASPVIDMLALERALGTAEQVLDLSAIEQRYPLLRNTL